MNKDDQQQQTLTFDLATTTVFGRPGDTGVELVADAATTLPLRQLAKDCPAAAPILRWVGHSTRCPRGGCEAILK